MLPLQLQLSSTAYFGFGPNMWLREPFEDGLSAFRVGLTAGIGAFF